MTVFYAEDKEGVLRRWYPPMEIMALRAVAREAVVVMQYLEESGASVVPHLMDTDDNPGERLRGALRAWRSLCLDELADMGQEFDAKEE